LRLSRPQPRWSADTHAGGHSRWGLTTHKLVLKICRTCGLVLQFSAGRGIFDFD
jgi:hypothetical protein